MQEKHGICSGCPLYDQPMAKNEAASDPDIVVVGGFPLEDDYKRSPFSSYKSAVVKRLFTELLSRIPKIKHPKIVYTYAAMCCPGEEFGWKVDADTIHKCSANLWSMLDRARPKVVVAMGADAAKALGIKGSQSALRGGVFPLKLVDGYEVPCLATYHIAQVHKSPGFLPVLKNDLSKAVHLAISGKEDLNLDIRTAIKFDEVMALLDQVEEELGSRTKENEGTGKKHLVAADTETNTLWPYAPYAKLISVSMSYTDNTCVSYPIDHVQAGYTREQVEELVRRTDKILSDPGITLCMANAKFDIQWLRYRYKMSIPDVDYDIMLLEHSLEEDKKGEYSLKDIVRDRLPELGGYEDKLHERLEAVRAERHEHAKERHTSLKTEYYDLVVGWWATDLDEAKRSSILSSWVECGAVLMSETDGMVSPKYRKLKGELVLTKKAQNQIHKLISKIPIPVLEASDSGLASKLADLNAEMQKVYDIADPTFEDVPIDELLVYGGVDAFATRKILLGQVDRLKQDAALIDAINKKRATPIETVPIIRPYKNITIPLCHELADMEYNGITLDREKTQQYIATVREKMDEKLDAMYTSVGYKFNTSSSSPDLAKILYEEMGLPVINYTESGAPSTNADTLKELSDRCDDPFLNDVLTFRKLDKCVNTYLLNWLKKSEMDGRIHCSFNQIGTATYRLSSSNPNLQNVPFFLKEANLNLKALFTPDTDEFDFYDMDISNAEMRVLCGYSNDPTLISVFNDNKDIHCLTAAGISEYEYDDILLNKENKETDQYSKRQIAKKVNFGERSAEVKRAQLLETQRYL